VQAGPDAWRLPDAAALCLRLPLRAVAPAEDARLRAHAVGGRSAGRPRTHRVSRCLAGSRLDPSGSVAKAPAHHARRPLEQRGCAAQSRGFVVRHDQTADAVHHPMSPDPEETPGAACERRRLPHRDRAVRHSARVGHPRAACAARSSQSHAGRAAHPPLRRAEAGIRLRPAQSACACRCSAGGHRGLWEGRAVWWACGAGLDPLVEAGWAEICAQALSAPAPNLLCLVTQAEPSVAGKGKRLDVVWKTRKGHPSHPYRRG
jgi:hypothetical protein